MANPSFILKQVDPAAWGLPAEGKTFVGINEDGQIVLKQHDGSVTVLTIGGVPSLHKQINSSGAVITVTPTTAAHKEIITIAGAARVQVINIAATALSDGSEADIIFNLPATSGIVLEVYSGVDLVWTYTNDTGQAINAKFAAYKDGAGWSPLNGYAPAYNPAT